MNKLLNFYNIVQKARLLNEIEPEDLFLAGLTIGGLTQSEHSLDKVLAEIVKL